MDDQVLCPQLYRRLEQQYGAVRVANLGEAFRAKQRRNPETGRMETEVIWSGEYYRINCPYCTDTSHRCWVNHAFGQPDANGRPMLFLAHCYNEKCLTPSRLWQLYDQLFKFQNRNAAPPLPRPGRVDAGEPTEVKLPGECVPIMQLPREHPAVQYMVGVRDYPPAVLAHYNVSVCIRADPQWDPDTPHRVRLAEGRVIIPIYESDGRLVGWQARQVIEAGKKAFGPKYYGCPHMRRGSLLYNQERASNKPYVIVVEGVTDVWRLGDYAVAMLSNRLTFRQRFLLHAQWDYKPIIFLLETAGREAMRTTITDMARTGHSPVAVYAFEESRDAGCYTTEAIWNIVRTAAAGAGISLPV